MPLSGHNQGQLATKVKSTPGHHYPIMLIQPCLQHNHHHNHLFTDIYNYCSHVNV
jgi:hypothetical protein